MGKFNLHEKTLNSIFLEIQLSYVAFHISYVQDAIKHSVSVTYKASIIIFIFHNELNPSQKGLIFYLVTQLCNYSAKRRH